MKKNLLPALLLCTLLVSAANAQPEPHAAAPHAAWSYEGANGPEHWAELAEGNKGCASGQQESPIDLRDAVSAQLDPLQFDWHPVALDEINNGHTIQVDAPAGGRLRMAGKQYALAQFHLHHPSEHLLAGQSFPLELHFVHRAEDGTLGVVGVFVKAGRFNPTLQTVFAAMPKMAGASVHEAALVNIKALLPKSKSYYRYEGSLTTPPCSETVDWVVLNTPIEASAEQIKSFSDLFPMNARPVQARNRRFLLRKP